MSGIVFIMYYGNANFNTCTCTSDFIAHLCVSPSPSRVLSVIRVWGGGGGGELFNALSRWVWVHAP